MGTENQGYPNFPARPPPPSSSSPFASAPPPGVPPQSGGFRPLSQPTRPFTPSGPPMAPPVGAMRPVQSPFVSQIPGSRPPPPPAYGGPPPGVGGGSFQRFPAPPPPFPGAQNPPPSGPPSTQTLAGHLSSLRPQQPMGPPPQTSGRPGGYASPPGPGFQQSSYSGVGGGPQPSFPGYPSNQVLQSPPPPMPFQSSSQGPPSTYPPQTGGFPQHPAQQSLHPSYAPPTSNIQGLAEDFNSLSLSNIPGSLELGLDPSSFPRPLDGDVEPKSFAEMYPMNCHPRYLRLTTSAIPSSQSLASRWHLPLGAVVCPLAEAPEGEEVPLVDFGSSGIIRCRRCRTYVNPYVEFTDSGRKWRCNICSLLNDVPGEYFSHLDATGRRMDMDQRPELTKGSVDFIAPTEYMVRPPVPPTYFFLIDVSFSATKSGMLEVAAQTIKSCLDNLPGYPRTQIGFITYDSTLHFYNLKSSLSQPQMMVVSDLDDIFIPLPDDLLVNLSESRSVVEAFLDSLPLMFQDNVNVESAFGPALRAAYMVMNQLGGKLLILQNSLPSLGAGRLKLRGDDPRVYGTDKEYALRVAEDNFYKQMAADCTKFQIGINVYAFSDKYTDIASLGTLAKYTGGQVYFYPGFQSSIHGDKLRHELARDLTRETAWESVMRIRCGKGIRSSSYRSKSSLKGLKEEVLSVLSEEAAKVGSESDGQNQSTVSITVVGASGDLAKKKIFPALFALYYEDCLPEHFTIYGYSRSKMTDAELRNMVSKTLTCRIDKRANCGEKMEEFLKRCFYHSGQYDSQEHFTELDKKLKEHEAGRISNRLFYLSIPPNIFVDAVKCASSSASSVNGWTRVIVEKPFGRDSETSAALTKSLKQYLEEDQIFRIDHYLGKELVENLSVLRFSNLIFEPLWSRQYIRNVQFIFSEDFGTEGRGGYFDHYGIIRDIMQNHLLQILALFAMETPVSLDAEDIRNEKVKVLRSMRPIQMDDVVIGQYKSHTKGGVTYPGYTDDKTVPKDSLTPTFAAAALFIDNARWDGVPFLMKAGKALHTRRAEIRVQFRHVPGNLYNRNTGCDLDNATNELVIRVQPDEAIYLKINNKVPGLGMRLDRSNLNLLYSARYSKEIPDAYERLLLDAIEGERRLFIRSDELDAAWSLFTPLLKEIEENKRIPEYYPYGSRGPVGAHYLAAKHKVQWGDMSLDQ